MIPAAFAVSSRIDQEDKKEEIRPFSLYSTSQVQRTSNIESLQPVAHKRPPSEA